MHTRRSSVLIIAFVILAASIGIFYYSLFIRHPAQPNIRPQQTTLMELTSTAFENNGAIPSHYTCDGANTNPPLLISGVPQGAQSLVLIMDDPDVPKALRPDGVFDHWVLFNIPGGVTEIPENAARDALPGTLGANGSGKSSYTGPCPPPQYEPSEHRYVFVLYALDNELSLPEGATKQQVLDAMKGHVLQSATLTGRYKRQ